MRDCVLIDSSAWISAARAGGEGVFRDEVSRLLELGKLALTDPVWTELYQGIRGKREETELQRLRDSCEWLEFDTLCWEMAGKNGRACLKAGVNVPFGDLLVHACSRRYQVKLLHCDRHFDMIDAVCP
ncbi:MAG: PIN domain-containing protein [Luteolibacter sp.]|uniref:PIN domain-containing protein n=1 Tax=Luteolibacter sp. TaxID=1962973 RepID=UPI00326636AA